VINYEGEWRSLARRNSIALEKQADPLVTSATWLSTGAISDAATKFGLCFLAFGAQGTGAAVEVPYESQGGVQASDRTQEKA